MRAAHHCFRARHLNDGNKHMNSQNDAAQLESYGIGTALSYPTLKEHGDVRHGLPRNRDCMEIGAAN
jgi:hypothetical protein